MANIQQARDTVVEFLRKTLNIDEVRVIGVRKIDSGWDAEAEVYEENSFLKSLGLPTRVQDRNVYTVRLDDDLQVKSYERQQEHSMVSQ
jgi:hypothetical protein